MNGSKSASRILLLVAAVCVLAPPAGAVSVQAECKGEYTEDFRMAECTWSDRGRTPFFVLEPGYWLRLEGTEGRDRVENTITVLQQTEVVDGVRTRVVEERELVNGELAEVSRNFFAICRPTGTVFYFGEDVDIYEDGVVVSHEGAWRAGVAGARAGVMMPGTFLLGSRYFQEIAPGVATDRACHTAMGLTEAPPAGTFPGCVEVSESSALDRNAQSVKAYCPGIGLVRDDAFRLADWSERP